ncbi:hypothetical protein BKN38_04505 [Helicobacter sp. CLO-3]|nr:hypothetical protein BA723_03485 [Helicobacter sp. CLO-3]OHU83956.1 hypothetical protein BKN38_04505 [Helicobacter sp. CLO-3]
MYLALAHFIERLHFSLHRESVFSSISIIFGHTYSSKSIIFCICYSYNPAHKAFCQKTLGGIKLCKPSINTPAIICSINIIQAIVLPMRQEVQKLFSDFAKRFFEINLKKSKRHWRFYIGA